MKTINPSDNGEADWRRFRDVSPEQVQKGPVLSNKSKPTGDLKDLIQSIERLQAKATSSEYHFLAYLLDMSRMEAMSLLNQQGDDTSA